MVGEQPVPRYQYAPLEIFPRRRSAIGRDVERLVLTCVWITIATGAIVFTEPAPFDVLMLALIGLLPVAGLIMLSPALVLYLGVWLIVAAGGLLASTASLDLPKSTIHTLVTLYLSVASMILAGFVANNPDRHVRLILNAYLVSAGVAAAAGLAGYFNLVPGGYDTLTLFGRARGTFKDPNVFGAFLVPPLIYAVHLWLTRPFPRAILPLAASMLYAFGILLSFSRGAWANMAVAMAAFAYLSFVTTTSNRSRVRLTLVGLTCTGLLVVGVVAATQIDLLSAMIAERATLDQSYDEGPQGRFGGHHKAIGLILDNPFGIGALEFTTRHHHEDVHNVYYSMFLNAGWVGGLFFIGIIVATLVVGLRHLFKSNATQRLFIVIWSSLLAVVLEGLIIDTDHWRHLFLLIALTWGLITAGEPARQREDRGGERQRDGWPAFRPARAGTRFVAHEPMAPLTRATHRMRSARSLRISRRRTSGVPHKSDTQSVH